MIKNCLLCGVGGQGTVLAAKLIAYSAMEQGKQVRTAETIGMAQRGGCVVSHVRIGERIASPLIPHRKADVLIGFEPGEAVRCLPYLKEGGLVVVSTRAVQPVTALLSKHAYSAEEMLNYLRAHVSNLVLVDAEQVIRTCGSARALNVALLGAAAQSGKLDISVAEIRQAICKHVPERFHSMNLAALSLGAAE